MAVKRQVIIWINAVFVNWNLMNKPQWISNIFFQENVIENVVSKMAVILSRP